MNSTDILEGLVKSTGVDFLEYFIRNTYFLPKDIVENRAKQMWELIDEDIPLPKRKSKKKTTKYKSYIDSTGNQSVAKAISEATNYNINNGKTDIFNYIISHVWSRKTYHPLYFSSLWNVVIIPCFLNYMMDKHEKWDPRNGKVQRIMKAICIELYNPEKLMRDKIKLDDISKEDRDFARKAIDNGWIKYLTKKLEKSAIYSQEEKESPVVQLDIDLFNEVDRELEEINKTEKMENRDFIFSLLDFLKNNDILNEQLDILTDRSICNQLFGCQYPILSTEPILGNQGEARYYKKDRFEFGDKEYFVMNDWYTNGNSKSRLNRDYFLSWVKELALEEL